MNKIYCSNCGQLIPKSSNYCFNCGAAQHGPESAVYRAQDPVSAHTAVPVPEAAGPAADAPKADQGEMQFIERRHLSPQVVVSFFLSYLFKTSILLPLLLIGLFFEPLVFGILIIGYFAVLYLVAGAIYQSFYFSIDQNGFQKEYGIIHKQQVSIPYEQIQNVNITRSLTDRLLGLSRISIESAGSASPDPRGVTGSQSYAEGHLPGVNLHEAKKIHDLLLHNAAQAQ